MSPLTTREFVQLRGNARSQMLQSEHTCRPSVSICVSVSTSSQRRRYTNRARASPRAPHRRARADGASYNHSYAKIQTQPPFCIFTATHINVNSIRASFTNTCKSEAAHWLYLNKTSSLTEKHLLSSHRFCFPRFRMGGIPAKTHKDEKLLIFLGIIDILQSYRYQSSLNYIAVLFSGILLSD